MDLLRPLPQSGQRSPTSQHNRIRCNTDRMKDERATELSEQASEERHNCSTTTAHRADESERENLDVGVQ